MNAPIERVNIVVLASLAAALTLVGLRVLSHSTEPDPTPAESVAFGSAFSPDGMRDRKPPPGRVAMEGGSRRPGEPAQPGATPGVEPRRRSGSGLDANGQSAELIAATERRRELLERGPGRGFGASDEVSDPEMAGTLLAGRSGAVPRAPAEHEPPKPPQLDPNQRHTFDFVDEPRKDPENPDVLVRIPFKGAVDPDVGGGSIMADGLVSHGGDVQFPDNAQLTFPVGGNVNSSAGTISFDVQPQWAGSDETNNALVQIRNEHVWENTLSIVKNFDALRFIIIDSVGVERNVNIPIGDWQPNEPHSVSATWTEDSMSLYINGQLVGQQPLANPLNFSDSTPVHVGSDFPDASYVGAGGAIRNFTIYGRALAANEITP